MEFKDMLVYLRKRDGYSQSELGKKVGVSASAIGMYEQGRRTPDAVTEEALADVFNVSLDTLRGRTTITIETEDKVDYDLGLYARLSAYAKLLNPEGIKKLYERAEELSELPKYRKED